MAVEKALKARYIQSNEKLPPYTHDLRLLASKIKDLGLPKKEYQSLATVNTFNVAGRYQDEKMELYRRANPLYAKEWLDKTKDLMAKIFL